LQRSGCGRTAIDNRGETAQKKTDYPPRGSAEMNYHCGKPMRNFILYFGQAQR
jgi:hypothetical protein